MPVTCQLSQHTPLQLQLELSAVAPEDATSACELQAIIPHEVVPQGSSKVVQLSVDIVSSGTVCANIERWMANKARVSALLVCVATAWPKWNTRKMTTLCQQDTKPRQMREASCSSSTVDMCVPKSALNNMFPDFWGAARWLPATNMLCCCMHLFNAFCMHRKSGRLLGSRSGNYTKHR